MKLKYILPFMESKELKELAIKVMNNEVKGVKLITMYPFLSNEDLNEIVKLLIEKGLGNQLKYVLPFVDQETIGMILEGVKDGTIQGLSEHFLYPFLGKDKIKEMFDYLVENAEQEAMDDSEEEADEPEEPEEPDEL